MHSDRRCSSPAVRRGRGASTRRSARPPRLILGAGWQVLHLSGGLREAIDDPGPRGLPPARVLAIAWTSRSRPPIWRSRAPARPPSASSPLSDCPRSSCPTRSATASRSSTRRRRAGGGRVLVADAGFTPEWVRDELVPLLRDPARVAEMAARIGDGRVTATAPTGWSIWCSRHATRSADGRLVPRDSSPTSPSRCRRTRPVHFVGIGGSGMSGIAHMLLDAGLTVTRFGPVATTSTSTSCATRGATITIGHDAANLGDADTIVFTERALARQPRVPAAPCPAGSRCCTGRRRSPGSSRGKRLVAVAGAHGKTTSTGMIVTDPARARRGPELRQRRRHPVARAQFGHRAPASCSCVEADESDGSFLLYDTARRRRSPTSTPTTSTTTAPQEAFDDAFVAFAQTRRPSSWSPARRRTLEAVAGSRLTDKRVRDVRRG